MIMFSNFFLYANTEPLSPFGIMGPPYSHMNKSPDKWLRGEEHLQLFETTGVKWARQDFWWGLVEPEKGKWEWEHTDKAMQAYKNHNINLLAILCYGSNWFKDAPATEEEKKYFGEFVFNMVNRYKDICKHWEIWNEPNILPFWSPKPNVKDYTELLKISYTQAKKADPKCIIVGGTLAGADYEFLSEMYKYGAKGYFDVLSYHTYGNDPKEEDLIADVEKLKTVMKVNNDIKSIWCTETGIYTGPAGVTEQQQAERIVKSTITLISDGVEKIIQLTLKDWFTDSNAVDATSFRGLYKANNEPKISAVAFKTMTSLLTDKFYLGKVDILENIRGHLFGINNNNALVLWSLQEPIERHLDLGVNKITLMKMNGSSTELESPNGIFKIEITPEPLYIKGVTDKIKILANIQLNEDSKKIKSGATTHFTISIKNPLKQELNGSLSIETPEGVTVKGKRKNISIAPDKTSETTFNLTTSAKIPLGKNYITLKFKTQNPDIKEIIAYKEVEITEPFKVALQPINKLKLPEDTINIKTTNLLKKQVKGLIEIQSNVPLEKNKSKVLLKPLKSQVIPFNIKVKDIVSSQLYSFDVKFTDENVTVSDKYEKRFLFVPRIKEKVVIDGDLSEWKNLKQNIKSSMLKEEDFNPKLNKGEEDISANGWLAYDENFLYLVLEVQDDVIALPSSVTIWDNDCLQVAIDALNDARPKENFDSKNDFEFEIALLKDGKQFISAGKYPEGRIENVVQDTKMAIKQVAKNKMIYEIAFPAGILLPLSLTEGTVFGFNFIINDNDGQGREGWLELTPGIGWGKEPYQYYGAILLGH